MLASPKEAETMKGFYIVVVVCKALVWFDPHELHKLLSEGFIVFAPYYRGNRGGEGKDEFAGEDRWDAIYEVDILKAILH